MQKGDRLPTRARVSPVNQIRRAFRAGSDRRRATVHRLWRRVCDRPRRAPRRLLQDRQMRETGILPAPRQQKDSPCVRGYEHLQMRLRAAQRLIRTSPTMHGTTAHGQPQSGDRRVHRCGAGGVPAGALTPTLGLPYQVHGVTSLAVRDRRPVCSVHHDMINRSYGARDCGCDKWPGLVPYRHLSPKKTTVRYSSPAWPQLAHPLVKRQALAGLLSPHGPAWACRS